MKGRFILIVLLVLLVGLGYFALKSTDSDLRRSYQRIAQLLDRADQDLADLHPALVFLRQQKRRTFKLDGEQEELRSRSTSLRKQLQASLYNIEHYSEGVRKATSEALTGLEKDVNHQLAVVTVFTKKVNTLHRFVQEGFPLLARIEAFQAQMNGIAEKRAKEGRPLSEEQRKDLESYNFQCGQLQQFASQAMNALHTQLEQGTILTETTLNEAKSLIPSLEAFIEDIGQGD